MSSSPYRATAFIRDGREYMYSNYTMLVNGLTQREVIPRLKLTDITPLDRTRILLVKNKKNRMEQLKEYFKDNFPEQYRHFENGDWKECPVRRFELRAKFSIKEKSSALK